MAAGPGGGGGGWARELERDGFCVLRGVFAPAEVAEMVAAFARLEARAAELPRPPRAPPGAVAKVQEAGAEFVLEGRALRRVAWAGAAEPALLRLGRDPRLLAVARAVLGSDRADHLVCQAHFKLPGDGTFFPWHQVGAKPPPPPPIPPFPSRRSGTVRAFFPARVFSRS